MKCAPCVIESKLNEQPLPPGIKPPVVPEAVTQIAGTLVCADHAVATGASPRTRRDAVMGATMQDRVRRQRPQAG